MFSRFRNSYAVSLLRIDLKNNNNKIKIHKIRIQEYISFQSFPEIFNRINNMEQSFSKILYTYILSKGPSLFIIPYVPLSLQKDQWFSKCGLQTSGVLRTLSRDTQGHIYFQIKTKILFAFIHCVGICTDNERQWWVKVLVPQHESRQ